MKLILISPYSNISNFGIRSLSAYLKENGGHQVRLIFLPKRSAEQSTSQLYELSYSPKALQDICDLCQDSDLIGLTLMSNHLQAAVQITRKLTEALPHIPVVWGGIHPTLVPEKCLVHADMVCIGEGETALLDLMDRMAKGDKNLYRTANFWFKHDGRIVKNICRPLIQDLDSLPFPDYNLSGYHLIFDESEERFIPFDGSAYEKFCDWMVDPVGQLKVSYRTPASRGCPYTCSYCCNNYLRSLYPGQRYVRFRSPENLTAELRSVRENMPFVGVISLEDDCFIAQSDRSIARFSALYKEHIDLPLRCLGTPSFMRQKPLRYLVDAGLYDLQVGIQSANEKTLKLYNRSAANKAFREKVRLLSKFPQLRVSCDFILNNPWEQVEQQRETLRFVLGLPHNFRMDLFSLTLYPGTQLWEKAKHEGLIGSEETEFAKTMDWSGRQVTYINMLFSLAKNVRLPRSLMRPLINKQLVWLFSWRIFNPIWKNLHALSGVLIKRGRPPFPDPRHGKTRKI